MKLTHVSRHGLTLAGSGLTRVTTPPLFRDVRRLHLTGATKSSAIPDARGRITFSVDLGAANRSQEFTAGTTTPVTQRKVSFRR
jgi:hypothetical protein